MKILYIITQTEWGGAQKYVYELCSSPEAKNHEITVAVGDNPDKALVNKLTQINIPVVILKHLVRQISPIKDVLAIFELKKIYKKIKPDIIHTNSSKPSIVASLAFIFYRYKPYAISYKPIYIHTVHGWAFNENISQFKKKVLLWAEKFTAKYKDKIIFIAAADKKSAEKNKIKIKDSVIIHNGINSDIDFLPKEEARKKLLKNHQPYAINHKLIGTIANFYNNKGLNYFIEATRLLVDQNPNIVSVVIGDGELRQYLKNLITNYSLENHFLLLGKHENASGYLKAFDIYVSASVKEGLPYSIMEAMSAGLPIVATRVGGVPELIQDRENGLLAQSQNPEDLASKIKYLLDNHDLADELAQKANSTVSQNFTISQMIKKTFEQYLNN
ncbi:MAG TPA: glycosyltransferase family 4 protein [Patescibacteria group bacterium]|nr:glycosyltransferase family 4 protein [Patescibacteria group bacterium]